MQLITTGSQNMGGVQVSELKAMKVLERESIQLFSAILLKRRK